MAAHKSLGLELPVNLRFCFEGTEESGSIGLDDLIAREASRGKEGWFDNIDCGNNNWFNARTPTTYIWDSWAFLYFAVTVTGPGVDLHSGFGNAVYEPLNGRILIPGIYDGIPEVNQEEL
ncbi:hypothetical protein K474DRAFT_1680822 [Panus rudis PR-1116 ss-1]|nr:hypothetical protein K474DRAFT_1680822 [Panus rudis PR-1116 ss-1]